MEDRGGFDPDYNPGQELIRKAAAIEEPEVVLEPLFWGLFSLGGFVTAFLLPVTIAAFSLLVPLGLWPASRLGYDSLQDALSLTNPYRGVLVRGYFFLLIAGSFFHGAHRLTYLLAEAGLRKYEKGVSAVLHGLAILGSLLALYYAILGWIL